jgi:hypothetical protein
MKIVEDKRTLNAMKKANLIKEPKYCSFPRVDEVTRNQLKFTYKGKEFRDKPQR